MDVHRFRPLQEQSLQEQSPQELPPQEQPLQRTPSEAMYSLATRLRAEADPAGPALEGAFARDERVVAEALEHLAELLSLEGSRPVAFVGKLIVSKGVDLLLAAWPLVLERFPAATLAVVGFGAYRPTLERLLELLAVGALEEAL